MPFNYTTPTNITNFVQVGTYLNDVSGQWFGALIILSLFVIAVISFREWNTHTNLLTTCWLCMVSSIFLWLMGWLNFVVPLLFMFGVAVLMIWKPRGGIE
jgi:hypothetical protein